MIQKKRGRKRNRGGEGEVCAKCLKKKKGKIKKRKGGYPKTLSAQRTSGNMKGRSPVYFISKKEGRKDKTEGVKKKEKRKPQKPQEEKQA